MIDYTAPNIQYLDTIVSKKMWRGKNEYTINFIPSPEQLKELHKSLFINSDLGFAAGIYRTLPLKGGKTIFAPAYQVPKLMEEIFGVERTTVGAILAWTHDVLEYIHPFLDGNRRTIWIFTNMWLSTLGYSPINWEGLRPSWEEGIQIYPILEERLIHTLKELSK